MGTMLARCSWTTPTNRRLTRRRDGSTGECGRLDVLVNNAGIFIEGQVRLPPSQLDIEVLRRTYETDVFGVGRIYQQTFIDTYTKVSFAKLYDRKTPITAADLLNDRVLPFCEEHDVKLLRVLTDRGSEGPDGLGPRNGPRNEPAGAHLGSVRPSDSRTERLQFCDDDGSELCHDEGPLRVRRSAMN
jgi:hypothetical protein